MYGKKKNITLHFWRNHSLYCIVYRLVFRNLWSFSTASMSTFISTTIVVSGTNYRLHPLGISFSACVKINLCRGSLLQLSLMHFIVLLILLKNFSLIKKFAILLQLLLSAAF